ISVPSNAYSEDVADSKGGALKAFTGYTRPGTPSDKLGPDKTVIEAVIKDDDDAYGATVYFAVYENRGAAAVDGDTFGTGIKNFDKVFRGGKSDEGLTAPELHRRAKYLYLYQAVNERGTLGIITGASIRLLVEPSAITSWGYLPKLGFAARGNEWGIQRKISPLRTAALERATGRIVR